MRMQHTTAAISLTLWVSLLVGCGADSEGDPNSGTVDTAPAGDAGGDTNNEDGGTVPDNTNSDLVTVHWNVSGADPQNVSVTVNLAGSMDVSSPVWTGTADQPARLQPGRYSVLFEAEGFTPYSFALMVSPDEEVVEAPPVEMEPEVDYSWLNQRFPAYALTAPEDQFEIDCQFDSTINCFMVEGGRQVVTNRSPTDPLITLYPDQGFTYDLDGDMLVVGDVL